MGGKLLAVKTFGMEYQGQRNGHARVVGVERGIGSPANEEAAPVCDADDRELWWASPTN